MAKNQNKNTQSEENAEIPSAADPEVAQIQNNESPAASDEQSLEPEQAPSDAVNAQETQEETPLPQAIKMLQDFRISYPFRPDASMLITLKARQEITDTHIIKHLINSNAHFTVIK